MFSQYERQQLNQIERQFEASDPDFARMLRDGSPNSANWGKVTPVAVDVLGVVFIVLGVVTINLLVIFAGVGVSATGGYLHTRRHRASGGTR